VITVVWLLAVWLGVILGFFAGVAWKTNRIEDENAADGEQLPARGTGHVDHAAPAAHRAPSRFTPRNGGRL
jgi:hypothetical protein